MSVIVVPRRQYPMIQPARNVQNGKAVRTSIELEMRREANQIMAYRGREQFCSPGRTYLPEGSFSGTINRWLYRTKTSPSAVAIRVWVCMAQQGPGAASPATDPYGRFLLGDSGGSIVGELQFHYGANTNGSTDAPDTWAYFEGDLAVSPSTEYQGLFSDVDKARIIAATVIELSADQDTANGYLAGAPAQGENIYDSHRQQIVTFANQFGDYGHQCFNFQADDHGDPYVRTSATDINAIDRASTTISASTPGYQIDMTGKDLATQTSGVPCQLWAYGLCNASSAAHVKLKDSGGTTLATVTLTTSLGWRSSGTFNLPATNAKYDLHYSSNGTATASLYHASCYEVAS